MKKPFRVKHHEKLLRYLNRRKPVWVVICPKCDEICAFAVGERPDFETLNFLCVSCYVNVKCSAKWIRP
jgi:hypothetical protein